MPKKTTKFFITTPIYYVNSQPHIGHAYTTVAADVLTRYHRLQGKRAFFLTGTDEHGAKIFQAAQEASKQPQEFCDEIAGQFKKAWANLHINYSHFIRTTDKQHGKAVKEFLNQLYQKDFLYEAEYQGLYCVGCEKFITEKELVDGKCPDHKKAPERVSEKNWFFKLKQFLPQIEKLIEADKLLIRPANAKNEVLGLFKQGLDDFSVSRQKVSWGIPLPWDKSQTVYVWVDALLNYWTALTSSSPSLVRRGKDIIFPLNKGELEGVWPPDLHLIARDILKFHAVYWPAMLLAAGLKLPRQIFIHGYFTVNGQKMSKTLGNVIDPNDLIAKFGVDATRYLLLSQFPFGKDGNISMGKLTETYNADLAHGLGNLVARVAKFSIKYQGASIKEGEFSEYNDFLSKLKMYEALMLIQKRIKYLDGLVEKIKPWQIKDKMQQRKALTPIIKQILTIAQMLKPFMPTTTEKIIKIFQTGKSEILFPRI